MAEEELTNLQLYHSALGTRVDDNSMMNESSWILPTRILEELSSSTTPGDDDGVAIPAGINTDRFMFRQVFLSGLVEDFMSNFTPFQLLSVPRNLRMSGPTFNSTPSSITHTLQPVDGTILIAADFKMRWRPTSFVETHSEFFGKRGFEWVVPGSGKTELDGFFGRIRPTVARLLKANETDADEP